MLFSLPVPGAPTQYPGTLRSSVVQIRVLSTANGAPKVTDFEFGSSSASYSKIAKAQECPSKYILLSEGADERAALVAEQRWSDALMLAEEILFF